MTVTEESSPALDRAGGLHGLGDGRARVREVRTSGTPAQETPETSAPGWLARSAATGWLVVLVVAPMVVVTFTVWGGVHRPVAPDQASVALLKVALVGCLSFMPGWLYVRFLGRRAGALWNEYVLHLHRLGWDRPEFLPEPPRDSQFHAAWRDNGGADVDRCRNVYRQKFCAYFGRAADQAEGEDAIVRTDTMFPVFLATAFMSTGWTAVMWDDGFVTAPASAWDVLKFAFLGAYVFTMQSLVRRFFQSDLRPSAYASALLRFIVVLASTAALLQLAAEPGPTEAAVAFVIGIFPVVALQALQRAATGVLGAVVPTATTDYPLNQIDGLDLWYEARLLEEGIEDMQNLTTANLVDVMLHTRVPVARLVDWVDQAHLYLHLDRAERGMSERRRVDKALRAEHAADAGGDPAPAGGDDGAAGVPALVKGSVSTRSRAGTQTRVALRQLGVRTATDLLKVFPLRRLTATCEGPDPCRGCLPCHLDAAGLDTFQIRTLVRVLDGEPGLAPVWNWQANGVGRHG
ncbi:MAG TPA: hypothetical protein VFI47_22485 [Acidimicrobiales bacterium]|nr:hypothetical protein [Acidimicrobiales bacterium]